MKLYYSKGACSLSPHIALAESGLPYQLESVNLGVNPHQTGSGGDYSAINPKGSVPALQLDNGEILTEGPAIVQYIADQAPNSKLAPANGSLPRYRLQEWLNYISSEIHKTYSPLWNPNSAETTKEGAWKRLELQFARVDSQLAGKDYLMGEFSVADAYLFTVLNWVGVLGRSLDQYSNIQAFMARMAARPGVQKALKEEGLL